MKRFQRISLSLLAVFAVWFSMANAYTFEVTNRSPFGVLNLKTLNLKPDTTHTGIILDWAAYIIKIDPNHESDWAIRVDQICDESWTNCKTVANLWNWGWSSITISGTNWAYCYKKDDNTLYCSNSNLPSWTSGAIANWTNEYICVKNGSNLTCNRAKLGTLTADKRCTFDGTNINCDEEKPSGGTGWTDYTLPVANVSKLWGVKLYTGTRWNETVSANRATAIAWRTYPIQLNDSDQMVVYVPRVSGSGAEVTSFQNNSNYYCYATAQNRLDCSNELPTWWGDSLWEEEYQSIYIPSITSRPWEWWGGNYQSTKVLSPLSSTTPLYFSTDFYHSAAFNFYTYNSDGNAWPSTRVTFDQKWIRLWNGRQMFTWAWLAVAWAIVAWNTSTDNYIRIYATWTNNSPNKHYEVMASQELAVWTYSGAFIYFKNYENANYSQYRIWVNNMDPMATLDIKWSLRIDTTGNPCVQTACNDENRWTIVFDGNNFYGCTSSWWKKFTTWNWSPTISSNCAVQWVEPWLENE